MATRNGETPAHGAFPSNIPEQNNGNLNQLTTSIGDDRNRSKSRRCRVSSSLRFDTTTVDNSMQAAELDRARDQVNPKALRKGLKKIIKPQLRKPRHDHASAPKFTKKGFNEAIQKVKSAQEVSEDQIFNAVKQILPRIKQMNTLKAHYGDANMKLQEISEENRILKSRINLAKHLTKDAATQTQHWEEEEKKDGHNYYDDVKEGSTEYQYGSLNLEDLSGALAECRQHAKKLGQDLENEEVEYVEREGGISNLDASLQNLAKRPARKRATGMGHKQNLTPEEAELARCKQSNRELQRKLAGAEEVAAQLTHVLNGLTAEDVRGLHERFQALKEEHDMLMAEIQSFDALI